MFKEYIANAAMLVAFVSVSYQVFRNTGLSHSMPVKFKLLSGGIFGLLGIILMLFSINLPNNLMIDFRNLAILLAAITGGCIPALFASFIIGITRAILFGVSRSLITAVTVMIILSFVFCFISKLNIKTWQKWLCSILVSEIISSIAFSILIKEPALRNEIIISYCISLSLVSALLYSYVKYIDALTKSYRMYKQEAKRDFLTGLNNVRHFDALFNRVIDAAKTNFEMVSLLYIDIDFFKRVNDTYGHKEGDIVLVKLAEILTQTCRSTDIISRNGGEEFSVILVDCPPAMAVEIAERIRKNVEATPIKLSGKVKINITVSIGIASYPDPINDFDILREKADGALYEAKRTGRNKVVLAR